MKEKELNKFCELFTFGTEIKVLDESADKKEIEKVAKAHKIQLPCRDLAILKAKYGFTEEQNGNGCTLPEEEVQKALLTIGGKLLDIDHFRTQVRGHWLEGYLENNTIYAYAVIYKEAFKKDFATIKKKFEEGKLKMSLEAWGTRVYTNVAQTEYELHDIEFSGGAILINTRPAFKDAEIMELAKECGIEAEPALEFCHVKKDDHKEKSLEKCRFYASDFGTIMRLVYETVCPECASKAGTEDIYPYWSVDAVSFENSLVKLSCGDCKSKYVISVSPRIVADLTSEQSNRKIVKIEKEASSTKDDKSDNGNKKPLEEKSKMDHEKIIKELQEKMSVVEAANATLKTENESLKSEIASAKVSFDEFKTQVEAEKKTAVEAALTEERASVEKAKKLAERKTELGEFAKDMKDEDILNDDKFELAKTKKENASLQAQLAEAGKGGKKTPEKASTTPKLEVGSKAVTSDEVKARSARVSALAFGNSSEDEE